MAVAPANPDSIGPNQLDPDGVHVHGDPRRVQQGAPGHLLDALPRRGTPAGEPGPGVPCLIGFQRRYDPTFAALKRRLDAGEVGEVEVLAVTSRDPGAPPVAYLRRSGGIFKDMLIHDFDVCRWILADEAATVYAAGSCLTDPAIAEAGDADTTAVTIRTRRGRLCQINTSRRAAYGYDQRFEVLGSRGMLAAGNHRPTEVTAHTPGGISSDTPEPFFFERYRAAYAEEMLHFNATRRRWRWKFSSCVLRDVPSGT